MSTTSFHMKTILAGGLVRRLEELGRGAATVIINTSNFQTPVWVSANPYSPSLLTPYTNQENDDLASAWLSAHPDSTIERYRGSIYLHGESPAGIRWKVSVGEGTCERVVVGKEWVPATEGYYRDVVETRCQDPLAP